MVQRSHTEGFVGRRWAVSRIVDWSQSDAPVLVVSGPAGAGKTALVNALAAGQVPAADGVSFDAVHRCQAHVSASIDPIRALAGIAGQLMRTVPGYQPVQRGERRDDDGPAQRAVQAVLDNPNPAAAYDSALLVPFEVLAARHRRTGAPQRDIVVVIDGLDETPSPHATSALVELLADRLTTRVAGLRLLLTVRSGPDLTRLDPDVRFDLVEDCPTGVDDVREYLDATPGLPRYRRAAIADAAAGSYLYAGLARYLAGQPRPRGHWPPPGVGALYDEALAAVGDPDSVARQAFSVLGRTRDGGFTVDQVAAVLSADPATVASALERGRHLLTGTDRLRPHHRCLSEHLWANAAQPGADDRLIGEHLRHGGTARSLAGGEAYALRNTLAHLADAAPSPDAVEAVGDTLTGSGYVGSALLTVGVDDLLSTLSYVQRRLRQPDGEAARLAVVLRRQAPAIRLAARRGDPTLASQQLVYEAATTGARGLARRFAERFPDAGVLTLWATADHRTRFLREATQGHAGPVTSAVVTGDGTRAMTTSKDHATRVWRLASGRLAYPGPTSADVSNMYAEPGQTHVVASTTDGRTQVWDADNGAPIMDLPCSQTTLVTSFAANGTGTVGVGGDAEGSATVWDLTAGRP